MLLVLSPFQGYLGSLVGSIRSTMVRITDERARTMNEVLIGIKVRAALAGTCYLENSLFEERAGRQAFWVGGCHGFAHC